MYNTTIFSNQFQLLFVYAWVYKCNNDAQGLGYNEYFLIGSEGAPKVFSHKKLGWFPM